MAFRDSLKTKAELMRQRLSQDAKLRWILAGVAVVIILLLVVLAILLSPRVSPNVAGQSVTPAAVRVRVSELTSVPTDNPTVAEISDVETLKRRDPLLYGEIVRGDFVLIYSNKVVIYRPATDKIIAAIAVTNS